jgi:hypothetical protein
MAKKKESVEQTVRNIRRKTRKQYSSEEKIRIVLEGLRGERGIYAIIFLVKEKPDRGASGTGFNKPGTAHAEGCVNVLEMVLIRYSIPDFFRYAFYNGSLISNYFLDNSGGLEDRKISVW